MAKKSITITRTVVARRNGEENRRSAKREEALTAFVGIAVAVAFALVILVFIFSSFGVFRFHAG